MKDKSEEMVYEAPMVEVIEVEVEKGFANSGDGNGKMPGGDGWNN